MITVLDGHDADALDRAARALRAGELVAFPTETVYGLGANALDADAVHKIFAAKGRPATNPLISHVATAAQAREIAGAWSETADKLAKAFWPGPLTLVVPRGSKIPDVVTAGLDTMGIRVPAHAVARELIERAERPLAAPSANRYTHVSPTTAQHVVDGLGSHIPFVVDAGPTTVGIESTVLSLVGAVPTVLRPGAVTAGEIAQVVGRVEVASTTVDDDEARPSPGLSRRHYAPTVPLLLADDVSALAPFGAADVVVARESTDAATMVALGNDPSIWARELYALLHRFGRDDIARIVVERPPDTAEWAAIRDRLERAASSD
jgi:L-threonylcarbamoyladenylate synthase